MADKNIKINNSKWILKRGCALNIAKWHGTGQSPEEYPNAYILLNEFHTPDSYTYHW